MGRFDHIRTQADMAQALNLLDGNRVRVIRVRLQSAAQATGQVSAASTPATGEVITIDDGEGNAVTFEFTDGGGATGTNTEVDKSSTVDAGMSELLAAINGSALNITADTVTGGGPYVLPLTHDTDSAVGNDTVMTTDASSLTLTQLSGGRDGNLDAAATTQVIQMPALPANSFVIGAAINLVEEFAGGSVSAATIDVGDSVTANLFIAAEDVFTAAGTGIKQGSPGAGLDGTQSGPSWYPAAETPEVLVTTTTDDVAALQAGIADVILLVSSPPAAE